ncbi:uncharacterized protein GGS25DRAFT_479222, partial [Hypoxylon fragiforme]|uniref:uncharacterized protein n=1 Tax=Hypoxylon fragiforme TaxID=63214 RepID=UPI0020C71CDA
MMAAGIPICLCSNWLGVTCIRPHMIRTFIVYTSYMPIFMHRTLQTNMLDIWIQYQYRGACKRRISLMVAKSV